MAKFTIGDKVFLCNRGSLGDGTIIDLDAEKPWASIKWDYPLPQKPKLCHVGELVKVNKAASDAIVERVKEMRAQRGRGLERVAEQA